MGKIIEARECIFIGGNAGSAIRTGHHLIVIGNHPAKELNGLSYKMVIKIGSFKITRKILPEEYLEIKDFATSVIHIN